MGKILLLVHISLDGYVAGTKGEFDGFDPGNRNLEFVCSLTENADTALFGRNSFELLESHWPSVKDLPEASKPQIVYSTWYNKAKKIVVSSTMEKANPKGIIVINEDIPNEVIKNKEQTDKDILIFGSPMLSRLLMQHGLIDSYWIFVYPVIFGRGIRLFT